MKKIFKITGISLGVLIFLIMIIFFVFFNNAFIPIKTTSFQIPQQ